MGKNYDNYEMEIDLLELFYVLKSKILAILGVGLLFGCIACAYAGFLVKPLYTSSSMMLVLTKETTLSSLADLQVGSQLTKDYSILITSRPVLTDVIDQLDLDMDYKQLKNMITVANQDDTRILQLSVEYSDAKQAKEIVDKLSEVASTTTCFNSRTHSNTFALGISVFVRTGSMRPSLIFTVLVTVRSGLTSSFLA